MEVVKDNWCISTNHYYPENPSRSEAETARPHPFGLKGGQLSLHREVGAGMWGKKGDEDPRCDPLSLSRSEMRDRDWRRRLGLREGIWLLVADQLPDCDPRLNAGGGLNW